MDDFKPVRTEKLVPEFVVALFVVMTWTVNLQDEFQRRTVKIRYVVANRFLTVEVIAELFAFDSIPEDHFSESTCAP